MKTVSLHKHELIFVSLLIPFSLGILAAYGCRSTWMISSLILICIVLFVCLLGINFNYKKDNSYHYTGVIALIFYCFVFLSGSLLCILHNQCIHTDYYGFKKSKYLKIKIIDEPQIRQNIILFSALVTKSVELKYSLSLRNVSNYNFNLASGKIRVAIHKNKADNLSLNYGEELLIPARHTATEAPLNPFEFDYKDWLATQNIYHEIFLKQDELIRLNTNAGNNLIRFALKLREKQLAVYRKLIKNDDAFAFAATLILGYRADLSAETLDIYSKTGTIHVLSVSGMHVGLVYIVLNWLLSLLDRNATTRIVKTLIIISLVWFYALLTGFSPSVLRAAVMISVFITAKLSGKNINSYNIIAFAAFCLLLYNPFLIWDIGFQLSFLAVFGLIYLQPKIKNLIPLKPIWLNKGWDAIAMSLAAQLTTYPFSVYYFHQFPTYFLISNLFIMLPAALIMYLGILTLIFRLDCLGALLEWLIIFINSGLTQIAKLPFSSVSAIWLTKTELILLCAALSLFLLAINKLKKQLLTISFILFLCLQCFITYDKLQKTYQKKIITFSLKRNYAVALISAQRAILFSDIKPGSKVLSYFIKPALDQHRVTQILFKDCPLVP